MPRGIYERNEFNITTVPLAERFWVKVDKKGPVPNIPNWTLGPCWLWLADTGADGYARISNKGGTTLAYRISWEWVNGEIHIDKEIDHLCRVRRCVNPSHLEAVTHQINTLRGDTIPAKHARVDACPRGHLYTPENTYTTQGRQCRTCALERSKQRRHDHGESSRF